jgi:F-type H+-transporting ATPase subunit delta
MTELATMARPYAVAAFKRAKETSTALAWSDNLAFISAVMNSEAMAGIVSNPKVKKDLLAELVLDVCKDNVGRETINFLKLLLQNNRLALLPYITKIFEELKVEDEGYAEVNVITAFPFTKDAQQKFGATLEKTLSKKIHMNVAVDKSLIGGVVVRAGDKVIDGSIRAQLQHLQKALQ